MDSKENTEMKKITVSNSDGRDLTFWGKVIGNGSSWSNHCSGRWTEINIFKTSGGNYIGQIAAKTQWQNEMDFHNSKLCETEEELISFFESQYDGSLSWVAKEALDKAGISHAVEVE